MEKKIFSAFLYNSELRFSEIEKYIGERSNKLAYYLDKLIKKGVLIKKQEKYKLSETAEEMIPYLTDKKSVLPVILISIEKNKEIFLIKRQKRPFKNKLGLPGGRLLIGEKIPDAVKRIMKNKFQINAELQKINSISLEHVKNPISKKIVHSFLLIFVNAKSKDNLNYTDIEKPETKKQIISSDYKLIKNNSNKKIDINQIISKI